MFERGGVLYRQVNHSAAADYDHFMKSGLYESLAGSALIVPHGETSQAPHAGEAYRVLCPQRIPFISYPFEWSFSQLRNAALTTLRVQNEALRFGMTLKDASAYNIQFVGTRPIWVDTLSFERYVEGSPWKAFRQFCQHFLAPLALMSYSDLRLGQLLREHLDGIPLDLASTLLPSRTWLRFGLLSYVHLHARTQRHFAGQPAKAQSRPLSRAALQRLLESLGTAVEGLKKPRGHSVWKDYYHGGASYSEEGLTFKTNIVAALVKELRPQIAWDLGANTGIFSRLAASTGCYTISVDADPVCVEQGYVDAAKAEPERVLPLCVDLTNPSPGLGWENRERMSLLERGPADLVLALALVHHLAIGNNLPLPDIAQFFARCARNLVIEFIPKEDSQTQRLLSARKDIFPRYTREGFESAFAGRFDIRTSVPIPGSGRALYTMESLA